MSAVECFCGGHDACRRLAGSDCTGLPEKDWMAASSLKRAAGLHNINCNVAEKSKLTEVFKTRLHPVALLAMHWVSTPTRMRRSTESLVKNAKYNLFC